MRLVIALLAVILGSASADPLTLDVVTFNIRHDNAKDAENAWPKRKAMVGEWLAAEAPDVVGLQEAFRHQIDDLKKSAPIYEEYGVGRDDGKTKGEYSNLLYKKERFELAGGGTFWLSDTPDKIASTSWGNDIPRICTWARLVDKKTKRGFYVFNTHWDHRSQPSREAAAKLINQKVAEREHKEEPVILMGDFNADEGNAAILTLKGEPLKWVDTFREVHAEEKVVNTFSAFKGLRREGGKIDHVFVLPGSAEVKKAEIVRYHRDGRYLSDHYPVRAGLIFP